MTASELDAIKARVAAATPGPWRWWTSNSFRRLSSDATGKDGDVLHATAHPVDRCPDIQGSDADKDFLAHARVDVPALVAEVERLIARVTALETALRPFAGGSFGGTCHMYEACTGKNGALDGSYVVEVDATCGRCGKRRGIHYCGHPHGHDQGEGCAGYVRTVSPEVAAARKALESTDA